MKKVHLACQYFLNGNLEEDNLRQQVKMLAKSGYQSIYAHARQGLITPYFSKKYWDAIKVVIDECKKNNVNFSIWDEDCFPSGVAGNRILWDHPELSVKHLEFSIFDAKAGNNFYEILPAQANILACFAIIGDKIEDITEYCGTIRGEVKWRKLLHSAYSPTRKIKMPHWRDGWPGRKVAIDYLPKEDCKIVAVQAVNYLDNPAVSNNTDLMDPKTTELLLNLTHKEYIKQCGEDNFKELFDATFLDEPYVGYFYCWSSLFAETFKEMHNFDIIPLLPHLVLDINDQSLFVRHAYRMTQQKLLTKNYLGQLQTWCKKHNIISTGHLSRSESLSFSNGNAWPNEMKCYSFLDIPCTDPLGNGEAWEDASAYHTGIKVVSSVSEIYNKEQAGADTLAVLGHEATIKDLIFHLDYQMTLGLTYFNVHGLSYTLAGPRKDEVPPSIFYQHSQWKYMKDFLGRTQKLCSKLNQGKLLCKIAMLYPCATFYCTTNQTIDFSFEEAVHDLVEKMLSNQKDFIFIDEDYICNNVANNLASFIEKYPYFVIPSLRYLPKKVADILEQYASLGGKLFITGNLPILFGPNLTNKCQIWENGLKYQVEDVIPLLPGVNITGNGARDVIIQQRLIDNETYTMFFNRAQTAFTGKIDNQDIYLAPSCGTLVSNNNFPQSPTNNMTLVKELDNWNITFPENHLAIPSWNIPGNIIYENTCLQLLERQIPDVSNVKNLYYEMQFLYSGKCDKLEFVIEKDEFVNNFTCLVNNIEITDFYPGNFSDICFISLNITKAIKTGNSPKLNTIRLVPKNEHSQLLEVPFLRGNFTCEHKYSGKTMPYLQGFDGNYVNTKLQTWSTLGYGYFSGEVLYSNEFTLEESGEYKLSLGRVEGACQVFIDNQEVAILLKEPFVTNLVNLSSGKHAIKILVANGPGNRDRMANLPSGLIGPVTLLKN